MTSQDLHRERKRLQIITDLEKITERVYQLNLLSLSGKKLPLTHLVEATNTVRSSYLQIEQQAQETT